MNYLLIFLSGIVIGIANIIPGVSGGTMAVILNIFDRLVGAISGLKKEFRKNALFLLMIVLGAGVGIVAFTSLITYCLANFPVATNFFFIGLILGSIPMIFKRATTDQFKPVHVIPCMIAFGVMMITVIMSPDDSSAAVMTQLTVSNFMILFLASTLAAACMIIPGISGSFIMLLLGTYTTVTTTIHNLTSALTGIVSGEKEAASMFGSALLLLIPIALGCIAGLIGGAKLIKLLLGRYPQATYFTILGLVIGSIPVLLKSVFWSESGLKFSLSPELILAAVTLLVGGALAYFLGSKVKDEAENKEIETTE